MHNIILAMVPGICLIIIAALVAKIVIKIDGHLAKKRCPVCGNVESETSGKRSRDW